MTSDVLPAASHHLPHSGRHPSAGDAIVIVGTGVWLATLFLPSTTFDPEGIGQRTAGPSVIGALLGAPAPDGSLPSGILLWCSTILVCVAVGSWLTGRPRLALTVSVPATLLALAWVNDLGSLPASVGSPLGWYEDVRVELGARALPIAAGIMALGFLIRAESGWAAGHLRGLPAPDAAAHPIARRCGEGAVIAGLVLWVVAQSLPAYTSPQMFEDGTSTTLGLQATLMAWDLALLGGSALILIAWTANIWFLLALLLRWRHHPGGAIVLAVLAFACSIVGLWVLLSGGLPDSGWGKVATITSVGIGSWLWSAAMALVATGIAPWALPVRRPSAAPPWPSDPVTRP